MIVLWNGGVIFGTANEIQLFLKEFLNGYIIGKIRNNNMIKKKTSEEKKLNGYYYQSVCSGIGNKLMAVVIGWNNFNEIYEVDGYENITHIPIKYDYYKNNEVCGYKSHILLKMLLNRKDNSIFINNMWCELMKYVVEIENMYEVLKSNNLLKKSFREEKSRQIFESYYEVFKLIKLKEKYTKAINKFLFGINNFVSIQIREGSCDFNQDRHLLRNEDINTFIYLANELSLKHKIKKWFIASDCIRLKNRIITESNGKGFIYLKDKVKFIEEDEYIAAIELEILSRGSYFIITNQSSYSIVSLYRSGKCIDIKNNQDCVKTLGKGVPTHVIQYYYKI